MADEPLRKRNKKYNIEGHAHFLTCSCYRRMPLLTNDLWREWLAESIRAACVKHSVAVWAYVFMPEHFHVLLKPRRVNYEIAKFEHSFKLSSSRKIIQALLRSKSPLIEKLRLQRSDGRVAYRFWQPGGGHDLNIWNMNKAVEKAEYCHWNPIKRKLVKSPEQCHPPVPDTPLLVLRWNDYSKTGRINCSIWSISNSKRGTTHSHVVAKRSAP